MYLIHNVTNHPKTRTLRRAAGPTVRRKQFVTIHQHRLLPKRPIQVSEETLLEHKDQLLEMEKRGIVEVTRMDGTRMNIETMEPFFKPAEPMLPVFPDDSARFDPPRGFVFEPPKEETDKTSPTVDAEKMAGMKFDPPPADRPPPEDESQQAGDPAAPVDVRTSTTSPAATEETGEFAAAFGGSGDTLSEEEEEQNDEEVDPVAPTSPAVYSGKKKKNRR